MVCVSECPLSLDNRARAEYSSTLNNSATHEQVLADKAMQKKNSPRRKSGYETPLIIFNEKPEEETGSTRQADKA